MGVGLTGGIIVGLGIDIHLQNVREVEAKTVTATTTPKEVMIEVVIDWTPQRIEEEIRKTFPETPNTAVAVFKCESGLKPTAKGPTSDYGIAQVHAPSWHNKAIALGYENYRTDVQDNLAMARYIYDNGGWSHWVCYTKGMHKAYL